NNGFERHGFADALKSVLYALNPRVQLFNNDFVGYWHVQTLVDQRGWDEAKKEPEVREALQRIGSEGGRAVFETEMNSAVDNPLVFVKNPKAMDGEGDVLSGGNFHGQPLAFALDFLAIALSA